MYRRTNRMFSAVSFPIQICRFMFNCMSDKGIRMYTHPRRGAIRTLEGAERLIGSLLMGFI